LTYVARLLRVGVKSWFTHDVADNQHTVNTLCIECVSHAIPLHPIHTSLTCQTIINYWLGQQHNTCPTHLEGSKMVAHQYLMQETDTQGKLDDCMHMACRGHMHAGVRRSACGIIVNQSIESCSYSFTLCKVYNINKFPCYLSHSPIQVTLSQQTLPLTSLSSHIHNDFRWTD